MTPRIEAKTILLTASTSSTGIRSPLVICICNSISSFFAIVSKRTASGVGIGSPIAAVERLRGAHCRREAGGRYCGIGNRDKPLSRFTMFWIGETQRVTLVSVSLVVNS